MSAIVSGLIGVIATVVLVAIAQRSEEPARANSDGWKTLRAGWLLNFAIMGCIGAVVFIGFFFLSGGSALPDADTQNFIALVLLIGFGAGAIYTTWASYSRMIMWRGNELRVRTRFGQEIVRRFSDISSVTKNEMTGEYRLKFHDGSTLRFSAYFYGARELVAQLPRE